MTPDEVSDHEISRDPDVDELNNGAVRIVLDISDPVMDPGLRTDRVSIASEQSIVTEELAEHLQTTLHIDITEHDVEVVE